ncbi:uncharacterized protein LOC143890306 [Tasmannia lanceolata]|uniref:uncharacterized protein LOC143890306 n=1 Tax=Tasmannia lanceolata TaxID=3420 RepID=UPI004064AEC4
MGDWSVIRKIPASGRNEEGGVDEMEYSGGGTSLADMVLGFFVEGEGSPEISSSDGDCEEGDGNSGRVSERTEFWETQQKLLKETLYRRNSLEARIRHDTEQALKDSQSVGPICVCLKTITRGGCRNCLLRDVSDRLRNSGYNSALCTSKWRRSPDIPSGEHTYVDVIDAAIGKKAVVRVVIELDFRSEFEMARANTEYNELISHLPQVFIGKEERLRSLIKILCTAARKCMKENKMHMAPWRKHKYMEAKWFGTCERMEPGRVFSASFSDRQPKLRASMLTFDLLGKLPNLHCNAVQVV